MAPSRRFFFLPVVMLLACGGLANLSCGQDRFVDIVLKPGEPGANEKNPLEIPSWPGGTASVKFIVSAVDGFRGEVSVLVFPSVLEDGETVIPIQDENDIDRSIAVGFFPARPYTLTDTSPAREITVSFDAEDGLAPPEDSIYRIRVSAGAVGELVESGADLYFRVVP